MDWSLSVNWGYRMQRRKFFFKLCYCYWDLGKQWPMWWRVSCQHQAITWTKVDLRILVPIPVQLHRKITKHSGKSYDLWFARGQRVDTLRPRQNGRHFADGTSNSFMNESVVLVIQILLNLFPTFQLITKWLVRLGAWLWAGTKPLFEPMMA